MHGLESRLRDAAVAGVTPPKHNTKIGLRPAWRAGVAPNAPCRASVMDRKISADL